MSRWFGYCSGSLAGLIQGSVLAEQAKDSGVVNTKLSYNWAAVPRVSDPGPSFRALVPTLSSSCSCSSYSQTGFDY